MESILPFWLAGAGIVILMALAARANRRRGWRRQRSEADVTTLCELLDVAKGNSTPVVALTPRVHSLVEAGVAETASLAALEAALRRLTPAPETAPPPPQTQTADDRVAAH